MERKIYAVFPSGGRGTRMGAQTPKQFLELCGTPVLQRSISVFADAVPLINIITVLPKDHFDTWKELCIKHSFDVPQTLVEGGLTRFHSVKNALSKIPDGATVMIHDGVRPLVKRGLILKMLELSRDNPAVIPVVPVTDTIRWRDGRENTPDRSALAAVQTPQVFHSEILKAAYSQAYDESFTDDASVVDRYGYAPLLCEGDKSNIKITTPEDLVIAEALLTSFSQSL